MMTANFMCRLRAATSASIAAGLLLAGCGGGGNDASLQGPEAPSGAGLPRIDMVVPSQGPASGGTEISIFGAGFLDGVSGPNQVLVGGAPASSVQTIDDSEIRCVTPAGPADTLVDVSVVNSLGTAVLADAFEYLGTGGIQSDLNADGIPDVVVAAPSDGEGGSLAGSAFVFYGRGVLADESATEADVKIVGTNSDRLGTGLAAGDLNGDGHDDLAVGSPFSHFTGNDSGVIHVFFGPLPESATLSPADADVVITAEGWGDVFSMGDRLGAALEIADLDGDGFDDLIAGAPGMDVDPEQPTELLDAGAVYVFRGGPGFASTSAFDADVKLLGLEAFDLFGSSIATADVSGDGISDLVVGAPKANPYLPPAPKRWDGGAAYVFLGGPTLTSGDAGDADVLFAPEQPGDRFGTSVAAGDVDGDGFGDVAVSALWNQAFGSSSGRAYLFRGSASLASTHAEDADFIFTGVQSNGDFGEAVSIADVTGDGWLDLLIGAPRNSLGALKNGRTFVFYGGPTMADALATFADAVKNGAPSDNERFGRCIEVVDSDQDGVADPMMGATGSNGGAGAAFLFLGAPDLPDENAEGDDMTFTGADDGSAFGLSITRG